MSTSPLRGTSHTTKAAQADSRDLISRSILGMWVDATSYDDASWCVVRWAREGRSVYVCVATVHMIMETVDSVAFRQIVKGADLVTPDGRPLVWALRSLGVKGASQVRGTDLTAHVVERAAREGTPIRLSSPHGRYAGRIFRAPIKPGNLEVHWPEGNVLLGRDIDPESMEPDYNAMVTIETM